MIEEEINKKIGRKENLVKQLIEFPRESIIKFEAELGELKKLVDGFNFRLMQLEDICKVVEKVNEHMEAIELVTERLVKLEEEFILFKLKLLEQKNGELLDNSPDSSGNPSNTRQGANSTEHQGS